MFLSRLLPDNPRACSQLLRGGAPSTSASFLRPPSDSAVDSLLLLLRDWTPRTRYKWLKRRENISDMHFSCVLVLICVSISTVQFI